MQIIHFCLQLYPQNSTEHCLFNERYDNYTKRCEKTKQNDIAANTTNNCSSGMFYSKKEHTCLKCAKGVEQCLNKHFAISCKTNYFLFRHECQQFGHKLNSRIPIPHEIGNWLLIEGYKQITQQKLEILKKNVNKKYFEVIDRAFDEMTGAVLGYDEYKYQDNHKSDMMLQIQEEYWRDHSLYKKTYNLSMMQNYYNYNPETFYHHNGLKFRSQKVKKYVSTRDILDLGAYQGDSLAVLRNYTNQKVYSFEFMPQIVKHYENTARLNNITNYVLIQKAVSSEEGTMYVNDEESSTGSLDSTGNLLVNVTTVDSEQKKFNFKPGFIKADLEGHLLPTLKGAIQTIKQYRPVMALSIYHSAEEFFEAKPYLESQLENYEYGFELEQFWYGNILELNLLCIPKELL
ncbi:Methyltransferase [Hexamita inflata]|uniref:FkbM family protein n=1 Tax=Hexamita inflata TaxID=28002 RepID=A0AA86RFA7_9EUKA|nr:FkbM family protein [Hexamita inflata]